MSNSIAIQLNNAAIDALYVGDIEKGFKILSHTFFDSIRNRHKLHRLTMDGDKESTSLEFSIQDCSQELSRRLNLSPAATQGSHSFLCLNFLRMEIPRDSEGRERVDQLCSCAVAWALGYNLSIVYALMGFQRSGSTHGTTLMKKALRTLLPIKRQIMLQKSNSPFWTNLKLSILNNYICILRECGTMDVKPSVMAMQELLAKSRTHLDPMDVKKFYLSIQFMDVFTCIAAAA